MKFFKTLLIYLLLFLVAFFIGFNIDHLNFKNEQNKTSNISKENIILNSTSIDSNQNIQTEVDSNPDIKNESDTKIQDFSGKWTTISAVDTSTWNTIDNLVDIFGTSYLTYGSYLQLNSDNTFLDAIFPVTSDENSTTGTYSIQNDYYKVGDCVIILNYSDGRKNIFKVIYEDNSTPLLMQDISNNEPYQFNLEKK